MLHWFNAVSFSFEEEPGEFKWDLESLPNNNLGVKIFEGYRDHGASPHWKYKLLFQTTSTQMKFGRAVAKAADALLKEYGEDGYLEKWVEYPFPTGSLQQLNQLLTQLSHLEPLENEDA